MVLVEDHVERTSRIEVADRKVIGRLATGLACGGAFLGDPLEVLVRIHCLPSRGGAGGGECRVDGTQSPFPATGLPAVVRQPFVAIDEQGYVLAGPQVLDDIERESVPEVPGIPRSNEFPGGPGCAFLVRAPHGLLEQTRDIVSIVPASRLVVFQLFPEVVRLGVVLAARIVGVGLAAAEGRLSVVAHDYRERGACM